jgi:outer membrane protein
MKNTIIVALAFFSSLPAFAQISKGTSTWGGNISLLRQSNRYIYEGYYPQYNNSKYKTNTLSITPSYGYFVVNNLSVGANVSGLLSHSVSEPPALSGSPELESSSRSIGVGPAVRYYLPLDDKLYAYAASSYAWFWSRNKFEYNFGNNDIGTSKSRSRYTTWDAGLGLSYFVNPSTALEAGFAYTNARYKDDNGDISTKTNNISFHAGFRVFLRKG